MPLEIAVLSKTGARSYNEDACGVWSGGGYSFCVLCDGLGGHGGGDIAARLVVRHVLEALRAQPACDPVQICDVLQSANTLLLAEQRRSPALNEMRATAVVLALNAEASDACWGHVGDSRLYCFRQGRVLLRTRDDSLVQEMLDAGYLRYEQAKNNPLRNRLLAALGDESIHPQSGPQSGPQPGKNHFRFQPGDAFLLCSDGLWDSVEDIDMLRLLIESSSVTDWLARLEQSVIKLGREEQDNYSAIAVWYGEPNRVEFDPDVTLIGC